MNNQTKLTWKYFFEQKVEEIFIPSLFLTIPFVLGFIIFKLFSLPYLLETPLIGNIILNLIIIFLLGFIFCFVLVIILSIILYPIYEWINDNWEQAKKRARRELKKR